LNLERCKAQFETLSTIVEFFGIYSILAKIGKYLCFEVRIPICASSRQQVLSHFPIALSPIGIRSNLLDVKWAVRYLKCADAALLADKFRRLKLVVHRPNIVRLNEANRSRYRIVVV